MNTKKINLRIEELETKIEQAQNRKLHADTRQQEANDQRDIDSLRAQLKKMTDKREVEFYECRSCKKRITAKEFESYDSVKAGFWARCSCSPMSDFGSWKRIHKNTKASEIIEQSCCGNLLSIDKDKLVKMVEGLEHENALLENQLKNAIAEIKRRK